MTASRPSRPGASTGEREDPNILELEARFLAEQIERMKAEMCRKRNRATKLRHDEAMRLIEAGELRQAKVYWGDAVRESA